MSNIIETYRRVVDPEASREEKLRQIEESDELRINGIKEELFDE
jgi:hypothetical protein